MHGFNYGAPSLATARPRPSDPDQHAASARVATIVETLGRPAVETRLKHQT